MNDITALPRIDMAKVSRDPLVPAASQLSADEFARQWNPGLENDNETLEDELKKLPGMTQADVHFMVRFFENPESRFALKGAVDLFNHDCIHIILGRGVQNQDEAFVIGFTMGNTKQLGFWEGTFFRIVSRYFYPKEYRFNREEIRILKLAIQFGLHCSASKIHEVNFQSLLYDKLGDIRARLKIDKEALYEIYAQERMILPNSDASQRLPHRPALSEST
ncbi:MAG: hypothetical protein K8S54_21115 [Spirochaetia bacterium]|nr:hypothetical protein [Spirochaetia bacterium]